MAKPVIDPAATKWLTNPINPGGTSDLKVVASDPDAMSISVVVVAIDKAGNRSDPFTTPPLVIVDPLTFEITLNPPVGTLTVDANDPTVYHYKNPG